MVEAISEKKFSAMVGGSNLFLRASIVLGMVAAVVTILYLTPIPDQHFQSCDRPCHNLDWPMICRIKLYVEKLETNIICQDCQKNQSTCMYSFCETSNLSKEVILANRQHPAPAIQVCQNDILVVDIINRIPGHSLTMHWRGQENHEAPFMDGVPLVTQCPIPSYTTFQYKFRASAPGTHFYHAYSDDDRSKGLFGALIVRQADKIELHKKLYDVDSKDHVILLSEWSKGTTSSSILINGKGPSDTGVVALFTVKKGKRHRFRLAYASGEVGCPIKLSVDSHLLKVIALDGHAINPYESSSVELAKGERLDFILKANGEVGAYFLRVTSDCGELRKEGVAIVSYGSVDSEINLVNRLDVGRNLRTFDTRICDSQLGEVCLSAVKAVEKIDPELREKDVHKKFYLGIDVKYAELDLEGFQSVTTKMYRMNNITFTFPSSPLLTQPENMVDDTMCNDITKPPKCADASICECTHIEHIPLGSSVEIILINQGNDQVEQIFHLHGHHFYVVGSRIFETPPTRENVEQLDSEDKLVDRNLNYPVLRDTVRVPKNGVVVLRFHAKNPGFWMLRDENSRAWTRGMDIIFQVGGIANLVSMPTNFPTCGNFIGPEFFLL